MSVDAFSTQAGLRVPTITTAQMREVDRITVDEVGPNLYQMMQNAGRNLAEMCVQSLGDRWAQRRIIVCAGTGGNGGGGMCAARPGERLTYRHAGLTLDEAELVCQDDGLHPIAHCELGEDVADVGLDGRLGYEELGRDFHIGQPARDRE